jgi:hypothetical protein
MSDGGFNKDVCDKTHQLVDSQHCDALRRIEVLEEDKRIRDAAGWKSFGTVLLAVLAAALSFYTQFVPKGLHP